jgi:L-glyceraldehyde 3-phosphate reductase
MKYRKIAKWPIEVSEVGFGTGDNAGAMVHGTAKQQRDLVEAALESGVTLFDTSPDYGKGSAETNLGRTLQELGAKNTVIVTKVEIMPEDFGRAREKIAGSINDSLLRLRRDAVDIIMLHNPVHAAHNTDIRVWTPLTPRFVFDNILPAFVKAREQGKVRFFGLNCDNAAETEPVAQVLETGEFTTVNCVYHLANTSAARTVSSGEKGSGEGLLDDYTGLFQTTMKYGVGATVIRPLAGGAFTSAIAAKGRAALHDLARGWFRQVPGLADDAIERARRFLFLDRPGEQTLSEAAYRFALANPAVVSLVGGFSEPAQLREAAAATDKGPLSEADMNAIAQAIK